MHFATDSEVKEVRWTRPRLSGGWKKIMKRAGFPPSALAFVNFLIEDFADEWVTKFMFHYRWAHDEDAKHAAPLLASGTIRHSTRKQQERRCAFCRAPDRRLSVVGSNETTGPLIEASFARLIDILDALIMRQGYVWRTPVFS